MANKFAPGDVVVLKSGGPPMTVDKVPGDLRGSSPASGRRDDYATKWFKGASSEQGHYGEHLLMVFVPPKKDAAAKAEKE